MDFQGMITVTQIHAVGCDLEEGYKLDQLLVCCDQYSIANLNGSSDILIYNKYKSTCKILKNPHLLHYLLTPNLNKPLKGAHL